MMIFYLLFSYYQNCLFHHPPVLCTFSLLEEKNYTKRETGKGARKPFVPSDEPEQSSDNVLGNSFLPPSRSPRSRNVPGESSSPIPRFASDHNSLVGWLSLASAMDGIKGTTFDFNPTYYDNLFAIQKRSCAPSSVKLRLTPSPPGGRLQSLPLSQTNTKSVPNTSRYAHASDSQPTNDLVFEQFITFSLIKVNGCSLYFPPCTHER